ncbi:MAG TPA: trypsin-like peptidase domain-containing protein [Thermoanaerobaculia bacterium]|nr:trypsin-like peptidase domain-containing protein [Thermoanaerobaculia bacterium]
MINEVEMTEEVDELRRSILLLNEGTSEVDSLQPQEELPADADEVAKPAFLASSSVLSRVAADLADTIGYETRTERLAHPLTSVQDVNDTTVPPWRVVAHLLLRTAHDVYHGSAFFITNTVLLTAGHNLFFHDIRRTPAITIYPGRNGRSGYGAFTPKAVRVAAGWLQGDPDADFGIIAIDQPLGAQLGKFGVRDLKPGDGNAVYVSGYPADRQPRTQCAGAGTILGGTGRRISYSVETLDGQSGGPVALKGTLTAVGVHVARPTGPAQAIRVTDVVKAEITGWLQGL